MAHALIAIGAGGLGVVLAARHPLWPGLLLAAFVGWSLLSGWRPDLCLFVIPAGLPVLDFSPWTGWLAFNEFDLLILGAIAGGQARLVLGGRMAARFEAVSPPTFILAASGTFVVASTVALWRGLADAGGLDFGWFQAYLEPMNSLRLFKPLLFALLFASVLQAEVQSSPERAVRRIGAGMAFGLTLVTLAVLWERVAYTGLTEFSRPYRAVGLFWEMHVGGAAIDAYLAMAAPFAAWAVWRAQTPLRWSGAALLALMTCYACLTTFSRGVYLAVALPLILLSMLTPAPWQAGHAYGVVVRGALAVCATAALSAGAVVLAFVWCGYWVAGLVGVMAIGLLALVNRRRAPAARWPVATSGLAAALFVEILAVALTGSLLLERMGRSERDLGSRIAHWAKGLSLLNEPSDWVFGIGIGRFPAHFSRSANGDEMSGAVQMQPARLERHSVRVSGPPTLRQLEGLHALTQRVPLLDGARYRIDFDYRTQAKTGVMLGVCELHLLYERVCQSTRVELEPGTTSWGHVSVELDGPGLSAGRWFAPRRATFELSVLGPGAEADFSNLDLRADDSGPLLRNGDFARELAHWFPSAQSYFVPWHVDSLYLELLIERGLLGLGGFVVVMAWTLRRLVVASRQGASMAPFLAASLGGVLLIGLLSSVMDAPRAAFLLYFLVWLSIVLCGLRPARSMASRTSGPSAAR